MHARGLCRPLPPSRPLDALAIAVTIGLCLSWGFNNVAIKLAIHDIPPLIQSAARSVIAVDPGRAWTQARGIPLFKRDGTFGAGLLAGSLFAVEFLLIYRGLVWTTVTRGTLFLYLAPFFVVIGSRWLIPGDRFHVSQWLGLLLSFVGIVIAFGLPTPAIRSAPGAGRRHAGRRRRGLGGHDAHHQGERAQPRQRRKRPCSISSWFRRRSSPLGALVVRRTYRCGAFGARARRLRLSDRLGGERHILALVRLIVRYSAARLSVFTFLAPLFGVAAGHFVLSEPLTPAFAAAVALVVAGLLLVNRPR